ncbi:hypothetical protein Tco_0322790 [Tanacetum coccineum]
MATIEENITAADSINRPAMLEKGMYDSWKTRIILYIRVKENGEMLLVEYEHVAMNRTRLGPAAATIWNACRFSRSHYQSVSKQTTRISQVTYLRACLMLALEGFSSSL